MCAPDSFKESLTAAEAAHAMARGVREAGIGFEPDACPVADGGEGTLDALISALKGTVHEAEVTGPMGGRAHARIGVVRAARHSDRVVGVVELAQASGLALVPPAERDPVRATTYGTGELIRLATARGCEEIIVCIGGSATVDGGSGLAQALGARFLDAQGRVIAGLMCGELLTKVATIVPPARLPVIRVACDVTNRLCGPEGAAHVYGPQKGATPQQVKSLDEGLAHLSHVLHRDGNFPGAGAAGGAGYGLVTMCGAKLERGIELVLSALDFESRCRGARLVLTGEGCLDRQSLHGKACMGVARAAAGLGVPTIAIVGSTGPGAEQCLNASPRGFLAQYESLADRYGLERALAEPAELVAATVREVIERL